MAASYYTVYINYGLHSAFELNISYGLYILTGILYSVLDCKHSVAATKFLHPTQLTIYFQLQTNTVVIFLSCV